MANLINELNSKGIHLYSYSDILKQISERSIPTDYKREGLINIGSNAFKLAGSVLLYGIVSAIILTMIKVILNV